MAVTGVLLLLAHYGGWYGFRTFVSAAASLNGALVIANTWCEGHRTFAWTQRWVSLSLARPRRPDLILVAAGLVFLLALVYAASAPRVGAPPTEFYVLTPSGELPFSLPPAGGSSSSQVTLVVGVRNGGGRPAAFEVVARARRDLGPVTLGTLSVHLLAGEQVEVPLVLTLTPGETAAVEIALYLRGDNSEPHRSLTVPVAVD
jgi:uncharacterized membrane protein